MNNVLVLNQGMMPINIITWQRAFTLISKDKVEIIEVYDDKIFQTFGEAFKAPCVIRLKYFMFPHHNVDFYQPFTRQNVWERDHGKCQYCGELISRNKFTFDHVIPKSRGGLTNWKNIVCSCLRCNNRKSNKTPSEAGMILRQKPFAPLIARGYYEDVMKKLQKMSKILNNQKWRDYIYWSVKMESD